MNFTGIGLRAKVGRLSVKNVRGTITTMSGILKIEKAI